MIEKIKKNLSKILIIAGVLFIVCPLVYELVTIPWSSILNDKINEVVLNDPLPPVINYIEYSPPDETEDIFPEGWGNPQSGDWDSQSDESAESLVDLPGEAVPAVAGGNNVLRNVVLLGYVKIPRINVSENLIEGSHDEMTYGIGHVEGSAMPGQAGNTCIAAHRVTVTGIPPFRHLDKMQNGDSVFIKFAGTEYTYEVYDSFIVKKEDVWVLGPVEGETHTLTMITCDPVIHPGNRPDRLIVRARLVNPPPVTAVQTVSAIAAPTPAPAPTEETFTVPGEASYEVPYAEPFKYVQ